MKNLKKENKGITLIALIITIIVLLILAVVTINAITGEDSLIAHANNAATKYKTEAENENTIIQGLLAKIPEEENNNNAKISDWACIEEEGLLIYIGNDTEITLDKYLMVIKYTGNRHGGEISLISETQEKFEFKDYDMSKDWFFQFPEKVNKVNLLSNEVVCADNWGYYDETIKEIVIGTDVTQIMDKDVFLGDETQIIKYNGTKEQWNSNVTYGDNTFAAGRIIKCTDGDVIIE